jgi:hypothetical protein
MTRVKQVSAWVPPNSDLEYSKKSDDVMMVFSIMDKVEREVKEAKKENASNSHNIETETIHDVLTPTSKSVPDNFQCSIDNILNSDPKEKNEEIVKPLKENNPIYGKLFTDEAAHLFRGVCECGRMKLWTKSTRSKTYNQDSQEQLLNSSNKHLLVFDTPTSEDRPDKFSNLIIIIASVFTILFLFWIRNIN